MGGSNDEAGLFEFDQLSDSEEDSGNDPPDEPDPPDGDGADENAPLERSPNRQRPESGSNGAEAAESVDGTGDTDSPDSADDEVETSNEPTTVASTNDSEPGKGDAAGDGEESSNGDNAGTDAPDPPDPSDGSNGGNSRFYEFNPVEESQAAFDYAEKQSRAAAKSAYKHAAASLIGRYIRKYISPEVRDRIDEVFSRRMLGSVFVGGAFSKILETSVEVYFGASSLWRPVTWLIIFSISTTIFVWWDHLARRASETAEKASEAATEAAEKATEAAQKASETAEKATEAAAEATGEQPPPEQQTAEVVGAGIERATRNREGGSTAATRAGGTRPTAVRSRNRTLERRPNKRFENEAGERVPYDEVVDGDEETSSEPVFEGSGFADPGDAEASITADTER